MLASPVGTAAVAAAAYAVFTLAALALHGWDPLWFVWIGDRYAGGVLDGRTGYDGQFVYYIARDGWASVPHLDNPAYRMQRILYPAIVRGLGGGDPTATAWLMLGVNFAAIVVTTGLLAWWLEAGGRIGPPQPGGERRGEPWFALVYAGFVGTFLAYSRDLTEPLAYAIGAAAVLCWLRQRMVAAIVLFALAALGRETTLLLAAGLACAELAGRQPRRALLLPVCVVPLLIWQQLLAARFGASPLGPAARLHVVPLGGALPNLSSEPGAVSALLFVALPILLLLALAASWLRREPRDPLAWMLALHGLLGLALPEQSYRHVMGVSRVMLGVVLVLVLAAPRLSRRARIVAAAWAIVPTLVWLIPVLRWAPWTATR